MLNHQPKDSFQKSTTIRPEIYLNLTNGSTNRKAQLYHIEGTTKEFNNGYDSSLFADFDNSLVIFIAVLQNSND